MIRTYLSLLLITLVLEVLIRDLDKALNVPDEVLGRRFRLSQLKHEVRHELSKGPLLIGLHKPLFNHSLDN